MEAIGLHERALLARLLDGDGETPGLRRMEHLNVFLDHKDLSKRDLILAIGFDHLGCAEAVREYEKRGVIVYERVSSSLYSKRMLESFDLEGAIRVSPLHCNSEADVDRFLAITREISEEFSHVVNGAATR
jgi:cysteine desulfurase/selenocysteine lyase